MPPSNQPSTALPLATNRAALSNKISLLLSQRTSLLRSLNTRTSAGEDKTTQSDTAGTAGNRHGSDDDDFKAAASRPNDGVGYIRGPDGDKSPPENALLRNRMMPGKRKKGAGPHQRRPCDSESDSDEGRASLGRAKRAKSSAHTVHAHPDEKHDANTHDASVTSRRGANEPHAARLQDGTSPVSQEVESRDEHDDGPKSRKRKRKNRNTKDE
ncbi:hypothetical protein E4U21_001215 [Claviceps maximensis]|nr:hypothetical protein E4U21_001215 [Claviceps maximensis]